MNKGEPFTMAKYKRDSLGDRIKGYESRNQYFLQKRTPVIIRLDMRAGHSYTKGLTKPFDNVFINAMIQTMESLCEEVQNCVFAYTQSDEITLVLVDYQNINTSAWFEYRTDKLCSISASLATYYFNKAFAENAKRLIATSNHNDDYMITLERCMDKPAIFDARCFNVPRDEVTNTVYWRQLDAVRNSVQACGQAEFSHRQLDHKNSDDIKEMLREIGKPWENLPIYKQRGTCCKREDGDWVTDYSMPLLVKEGRAYLEDIINPVKE